MTDEVAERVARETQLFPGNVREVLAALKPGDEFNGLRVEQSDPEFTQEQYLQATRLINKANEEVEEHKRQIARQAAEAMREQCAKLADDHTEIYLADEIRALDPEGESES